MLLRNNQQLALNDVETLLVEAADHYAASEKKLKNPELSELFSRLSGQRSTLAAELADHIRAMDDLPQTPDPDMETVGGLLTSVKALFSTDEQSALVDERVQFERKIADAARGALQEDLPQNAKELLTRIVEDAEGAVATLEGMRANGPRDRH
jgi:uncharacterized protein (TIGR02284 family)